MSVGVIQVGEFNDCAMRVKELNSRSTNSSCPACVLVPAFKRITSDDDYFVFEIGEKRRIVFDGSHFEIVRVRAD